MESHPLVYIRTDGNETIATGHLMRCLSIARALKKRGAAVAFLVSDDTSASILQKMYSPDEIADHSFPILELRTDYRSLDRKSRPCRESFLPTTLPACWWILILQHRNISISAPDLQSCLSGRSAGIRLPGFPRDQL